MYVVNVSYEVIAEDLFFMLNFSILVYYQFELMYNLTDRHSLLDLDNSFYDCYVTVLMP